MKKLRIEEIEVESYCAEPAGRAGGSVRAHALTPTCTNTMPVPWCTNCTELAECCGYCQPGRG
jgi:hypothetical protein